MFSFFNTIFFVKRFNIFWSFCYGVLEDLSKILLKNLKFLGSFLKKVKISSMISHLGCLFLYYGAFAEQFLVWMSLRIILLKVHNIFFGIWIWIFKPTKLSEKFFKKLSVFFFFVNPYNFLLRCLEKNDKKSTTSCQKGIQVNFLIWTMFCQEVLGKMFNNPKNLKNSWIFFYFEK